MDQCYDLHAHSTASDGSLSPADLVRRAAERGVTALALTDHDTVAGVAEASAEADRAGMRLIAGTELSVDWEGRALHVVGLGIDPAEPGLLEGLRRLQALRRERAERMDHRLSQRRIHGVLEEAQALAGSAMVTRTHFARVLVRRGYGGSMDQVFRHFLRRGKPGYVKTEWPAMNEAVGWILGAGGVAVLAHPHAYGLTRTWLRRICAAFADMGGRGIEVVTGATGPNAVESAAALARRFGLAASRGSDFHDPSMPWIELGRLRPLPADLTPVWRLL